MKTGKLLSQGCKVVFGSYAYVKLMQKTGMVPSEIMLFKDSYKACTKYYTKKMFMSIRSFFPAKAKQKKINSQPCPSKI